MAFPIVPVVLSALVIGAVVLTRRPSPRAPGSRGDLAFVPVMRLPAGSYLIPAGARHEAAAILRVESSTPTHVTGPVIGHARGADRTALRGGALPTITVPRADVTYILRGAQNADLGAELRSAQVIETNAPSIDLWRQQVLAEQAASRPAGMPPVGPGLPAGLIIIPQCPPQPSSGLAATHAIQCANLDLMRRAADLERRALASPVISNPLWRALTVASAEAAAKNLPFEAARLASLVVRPPVSAFAQVNHLVDMATAILSLPSASDPLIRTGPPEVANAYGFTLGHFRELAARLREVNLGDQAAAVERMSHRYIMQCQRGGPTLGGPTYCPPGFAPGSVV